MNRTHANEPAATGLPSRPAGRRRPPAPGEPAAPPVDETLDPGLLAMARALGRLMANVDAKNSASKSNPRHRD